jgi:hypothetical protein
VTAAEADTRVPLRLMLSDSPNTGRLDGAWWPQSRDLAVEFADLAGNAPGGIGRIVNVAYSKSFWGQPSPAWLPVGRGRVVRSRTFIGTADPDRVLLRLDSHRSLALMVVPPELDEDTAARAMTAAASPTNRLSALTLIAQTSAAAAPDARRGHDDGPAARAPGARPPRG